MNRESSRFLDELAKLMTDAAGVAQGARREVETAFRAQAERFLADMNVVSRDEFEAVKDMATQALDRAEALEEKVATLEKTAARMTKKEPALRKAGDAKGEASDL